MYGNFKGFPIFLVNSLAYETGELLAQYAFFVNSLNAILRSYINWIYQMSMFISCPIFL